MKSPWMDQKSLWTPAFLQFLFPNTVRFSAETLVPHGRLPPRGGLLEFVVSSWLFCWIICHRKNKFSIFLVCIRTSFALSLLGFFSDASNFSNSSKSAIRMSPFQILAAIKAYLRKIPGSTFFPNWWIFALSLSEFGRYSTSAPNGNLVLWMIPKIFVHTGFSRLPGGHGHFADSTSIPQNLTTTTHRMQNAIIRLTSLLLLVVQLVLQFRLFLCEEVWTFEYSMVLLHESCQIPTNCLYQ